MDTRAEPRAAAPLGLETWGPGGTGGCLCYLEKCCGNVGGDTLIRLGCVLLLFSLPPPNPERLVSGLAHGRGSVNMTKEACTRHRGLIPALQARGWWWGLGAGGRDGCDLQEPERPFWGDSRSRALETGTL